MPATETLKLVAILNVNDVCSPGTRRRSLSIGSTCRWSGVIRRARQHKQGVDRTAVCKGGAAAVTDC